MEVVEVRLAADGAGSDGARTSVIHAPRPREHVDLAGVHVGGRVAGDPVEHEEPLFSHVVTLPDGSTGGKGCSGAHPPAADRARCRQRAGDPTAASQIGLPPPVTGSVSLVAPVALVAVSAETALTGVPVLVGVLAIVTLDEVVGVEAVVGVDSVVGVVGRAGPVSRPSRAAGRDRCRRPTRPGRGSGR